MRLKPANSLFWRWEPAPLLPPKVSRGGTQTGFELERAVCLTKTRSDSSAIRKSDRERLVSACFASGAKQSLAPINVFFFSTPCTYFLFHILIQELTSITLHLKKKHINTQSACFVSLNHNELLILACCFFFPL